MQLIDDPLTHSAAELFRRRTAGSAIPLQRVFGVKRQPHGERGTFADAAFHFDLASVHIHNFFRDGKSQPTSPIARLRDLSAL
ncbi:hypothetical protein GCM10025859_52460 [Alicyclobacillus fastidiosus]|nr:hypothetical protein GCM10025859_52460 [Alicyclobacillus fastidiosus]